MIILPKPELLAPAGDLEKLKTAVLYGADAVYLGGEEFGLRVAAAKFTPADLAEGISFAHARGVRVYVTVNIYARNSDLDRLPHYLHNLAELGVDAIIVADPGVLDLARSEVPHLPMHLSTQANTTNWRSAAFWQNHGVKRIVLARELSLAEIRTIRAKVGVELEVFVHGAMCMAYSGRCLLSNYMTGRDANRGDCAQACRWRYALMEEKRPGQYFPVRTDDQGTYILSSRDLCLLDHLPRLAGAGVNSFKIEGRVKSAHYVATVTSVYRSAIDAMFADPANYIINPTWQEEIGKVSNRLYCEGFIHGTPPEDAPPAESIYSRPYTFVGLVREYLPEQFKVLVEQRNRFVVGDLLEVLTPKGELFTIRVDAICDQQGQNLEAAPHHRQLVFIPAPRPLPPYSMLRRADN